jgi:DNA-binding PadR family transcriptional regulator
MNLNKYLPLTETTYYILMSLLEPGHGYYIMQKVEELSEGKVRVAAGTMYGAIENLIKQDLITPVASTDPRRKVYLITTVGVDVLKLEAARLRHMIDVAAQRGF